MSDIPDWLVDLAAQRDDDDEDELPAQEPEPEAPPAWESREIGLTDAQAPLRPGERAGVGGRADVDDDEDLDVMSALRSQVESEEEAAREAEREKRSFDFSVPGLVPWQQFVLSILLFMDIAVIGLLFLVMLGRVAIP
jgi:hypothetical protein